MLDIIDPRRKISQFYFSPMMLLLAALVLIGYIGVPALFIGMAADDDGTLVPVEATREFAFWGYWIGGILLAYFMLVICINRMRAASQSLWWLLVPGYNVYLLFKAPDVSS